MGDDLIWVFESSLSCFVSVLPPKNFQCAFLATFSVYRTMHSLGAFISFGKV